MAGTSPGLMFAAAGAALARQARREWLGSPPHRLILKGVASHGLAAEPRDLRPADPEIGAAVRAGDFTYADQTLALGSGGHPWDQASPNRRFAVALHRFEWLPHLLTQGNAGAAEALRLTLEWRRLFGKWNDFSWDAEVMERRLFNLACGIGDLSRAAGPDEAERLRADLARQAKALAAQGETWRHAERLSVCALVYAALAGQPAELKLQSALDQLAAALNTAVAADGGHASRAPEAAMELLLDLRVLDETLAARGWPAPRALLNAMDRLTGAVRFFALADGRLPALQGGGDSTPERVAAALAHAGPAQTPAAQRGGFERLESKRLQILVDAAPPAGGPWSLTACAQPAALEILADGALLIGGAGWSPDAVAPQAVRLAPAASTATLGEESCGEPLGGFAARALGPRLAAAPSDVRAARQQTEEAVWLELSHDGWAPGFGLRHERRLYLDVAADDLRGEDRFTPIDKPLGRYQPFAVRFHLDPGVVAEVEEERVVRLSRPGRPDWLLRSDAVEVLVEPAIRYQNAAPQRTTQVLLRGQVPPEGGARLRWRLEAG